MYLLFFCVILHKPTMASLVAQTVKNLPAMWETWVWWQGWEDPLEKGMATHSSILAWRIPWTEEPGGLQSIELQRAGHDWVTNTYMLDALGFVTEFQVNVFVCLLPFVCFFAIYYFLMPNIYITFLPDPRIKPRSPALQADSLPTELWGKPHKNPKMQILLSFCFVITGVETEALVC